MLSLCSNMVTGHSPDAGSEDVPPVRLVGPADDGTESALVDGGGWIEKLPWSQASCSGVNGGGVLIVKTGSGTPGSLLMNVKMNGDCRRPGKRC